MINNIAMPRLKLFIALVALCSKYTSATADPSSDLRPLGQWPVIIAHDAATGELDQNRDGVIDRKDLQEWETFSQTNGGGSSWYDFTGPENLGPDGRTDSYDQAYIQKYIGKPCSPEEQ